MGKEKLTFFNKTGKNLNPFLLEAKKTASKILKNFKGPVSFIFVNSEEIKKLNKIHLGKNRTTDVITFNLKSLNTEIGEAYICVDAAEKQAEFYGHHLYCELMILTVHACLHLLGWKDSTVKLRKRMNRKTVLCLKGNADF